MDVAALEARVQEVHSKAYPTQGITEPATPPAIPSATTEPAPAPVSDGTTPTPDAGTPDPYEVRYRTLQGKYNAEVARLLGEVSNLTTTTKAQQEQINKLLEKTPSDFTDELLTDPDIKFLAEEYPSVYKAITKYTERFVTGKTKNIEEKIGKVEQTSGVTAVLSELSGIVPEWRLINNDPKFLDWLQQPVQFGGGRTKHQLLNEAYSQGNAAAMAEFFLGYKGTSPTANNGKLDDLRAEVAPPVSSSSVESTSRTHQRTYTTKQIQQFYKDVAMGKFAGREDEAKKMEAEFNIAAREGRIVGR